MPIQAPQWTEFLTCPVCCNEFDATQRSPISLACAHTVCKTCLANLHKKQCPFDQTIIKTELSGLPVNGALLQLVGGGSGGCSSPLRKGNERRNGDLDKGGEGGEEEEDDPPPPCLLPLSQDQINSYRKAKKAVEELALYLKPFSSGSGSGVLSRPMQRKLVTLINCQLAEEEGRSRAMRAARSLGDRTVTELILHHQSPQHLSANLWAAVRARGCQFLGPAMQEEVLKLVLLALEDGSALSRKVLVMFVVQRLEPHFPQASKTSIGHVVQLLYRASCFKVSKREGDSSLMQLKEEFRAYEALRREHDAQIVQIATEAGLRIAPDQWSALLYGDTAHKSHMQSIIDKLQSPQSFAQSVQELVIALQRTSDPGKLSDLRPHLELLASIDPNPEVLAYSMVEVGEGLEACRIVVAGLVEFMRSHGGKGGGGNNGGVSLSTQAALGGGGGSCRESGVGGGIGVGQSDNNKYKVSLCRDHSLRGSCPRGLNCTFAHSGDELDNVFGSRFRGKNRKIINRNSVLKEEEVVPQEDNVFNSEVGNSVFSLNPTFSGSHPIYPASPPSFAQDLYSSPTHNVILTSRGAYPDFPTAPLLQNQETTNRATTPSQPIWRSSSLSNSKQRVVASSLAFLQHRKQEILNQLERVVAKCNNNPIRNQESSNYSMWHSGNLIHPGSSDPQVNNFNAPRPVLYRSDSVLTEEEFIPFDPPIVSKYGPISREGTKLPLSNQSGFSEPSSTGLRNPIAWVFNNQQGYPSHLLQQGREGYAHGLLDPSLLIHYRSSLPNQDVNASKEFIAESQKMKQQLRSLEKKINDLKLVTEGAALSEGEKLSQELQIIEQGIREREKQLRLNHGSGVAIHNTSDTWASYRNDDVTYCSKEDSYEAGIANDIRELELRWEYELEEQEKRWSSEEESTKK